MFTLDGGGGGGMPNFDLFWVGGVPNSELWPDGEGVEFLFNGNNFSGEPEVYITYGDMQHMLIAPAPVCKC